MASSLGYSEINSTPTLTKIKQQSQPINGKKKITSADTEKLFKQLNSADEEEDLPILLAPPKISSNEILEDDTINVLTTKLANKGADLLIETILKYKSGLVISESQKKTWNNIR